MTRLIRNLILAGVGVCLFLGTEEHCWSQLKKLGSGRDVQLRPVPSNRATIRFRQEPIGESSPANKLSRKRSSRNRGQSVGGNPSVNNQGVPSIDPRRMINTYRYGAVDNQGVRRAGFQQQSTSNSANTTGGGLQNGQPAGQQPMIIAPGGNNGLLPQGQAGFAPPANQPNGTGVNNRIPGSPQIQNGAQNPALRSNLLPQSQNRYLLTPPKAAEVKYNNEGGKVTMVARNATIADVLNVLADKEKISFVLSGDSVQTVSFSLQNIPAPKALTSILAVSGHNWTERNGIVYVTPISQQGNSNVTPDFSGKIVEVFDLDYASAKNINEIVAGMLSASGKSYVIESDSSDTKKTVEQVVVEDFPGVVERVRQYVAKADIPPRQVLIEAYVLEIDLKDDDKHGVNFEHIAKVSGQNLKLATIGITPTATSTFFAEIDAPNLKGLIDALKISSDTRTLASPKVMVINGQESRLQVGQQLGFRVVTTTQTSSLEDVKFLDVGVVLSVTPRISKDGRILMSVKPEVSSGQINVDTGLPEEETSEVQTSVLLSNGKGMVIGGLIQEKDLITQSKVPVLGNIKGIGGLFRRTVKTKTRSEIVFVLIPRIVENTDLHSVQNEIARWNSLQRTQSEFIRSTTPLFDCDDCIRPRPGFNPPMRPIHQSYNGTNYQVYESDSTGYDSASGGFGNQRSSTNPPVQQGRAAPSYFRDAPPLPDEVESLPRTDRVSQGIRLNLSDR